MCLKLNIYFSASLNLAGRHHGCVSGKVSEAGCLLDMVEVVYRSQRQVESEDLGCLRQEEMIHSTFSAAKKKDLQ